VGLPLARPQLVLWDWLLSLPSQTMMMVAPAPQQQQQQPATNCCVAKAAFQAADLSFLKRAFGPVSFCAVCLIAQFCLGPVLF
jgi:hypothetical protein